MGQMLELHFQGRSGRLGELLPITKAEIDELSEAVPELVIHLFTTKEKEGRDPRQGLRRFGSLSRTHTRAHTVFRSVSGHAETHLEASQLPNIAISLCHLC